MSDLGSDDEPRPRTLADLRHSKGLSQTQLAMKAEVNVRTIAALEAGREGKRSTLERVARALGCEADDLAAPPDRRRALRYRQEAIPLSGEDDLTIRGPSESVTVMSGVLSRLAPHVREATPLTARTVDTTVRFRELFSYQPPRPGPNADPHDAVARTAQTYVFYDLQVRVSVSPVDPQRGLADDQAVRPQMCLYPMWVTSSMAGWSAPPDKDAPLWRMLWYPPLYPGHERPGQPLHRLAESPVWRWCCGSATPPAPADFPGPIAVSATVHDDVGIRVDANTFVQLEPSTDPPLDSAPKIIKLGEYEIENRDLYFNWERSQSLPLGKTYTRLTLDVRNIPQPIDLNSMVVYCPQFCAGPWTCRMEVADRAREKGLKLVSLSPVADLMNVAITEMQLYEERAHLQLMPSSAPSPALMLPHDAVLLRFRVAPKERDVSQ